MDNFVCKSTISAHEGGVWALVTNMDEMLACSGGDDGRIRQWDLGTGECLSCLRGHMGSVRDVSVDWKSGRLLSCSMDGSLKLWRLESGECYKTIPGDSRFCPVVAVDWATDRVLAGYETGHSKLWRFSDDSEEPLQTYAKHGLEVVALVVNWEGKEAVSGGLDMRAKLWDMETGTCRRTFVSRLCARKGDGLRQLAADWTERWLGAFSSREVAFKMWHLDDGSLLRTVVFPVTGEFTMIYAAATWFDGEELKALVGFSDCQLKLVDLGDTSSGDAATELGKLEGLTSSAAVISVS
eukprot:TRINITY_DN2113_c2_g1_i1.p1 TRINITY_DN2113_c2_g1~~TRINITY_DN2113_c2_g1_i1.p1  ORF type:complete len:296 (-),score=70.27 TRINITY_DN2113_c2_g1_i1:127-1014(-)